VTRDNTYADRSFIHPGAGGGEAAPHLTSEDPEAVMRGTILTDGKTRDVSVDEDGGIGVMPQPVAALNRAERRKLAHRIRPLARAEAKRRAQAAARSVTP
jgi:hypothetical protein